VIDAEKTKGWELHPVHKSTGAAAEATYEATTGTFTVPPRTAVVYVIP
jgi:hypothetical protein